MKFNVANAVIDLKGNPIPSDGKIVLFSDILAMVVIGEYAGDEKQTMEQKLARYRLKQKMIAADGIIDLDDKERAVLKECATKGLKIDMFGQVMDFLDKPITLSIVSQAECSEATQKAVDLAKGA